MRAAIHIVLHFALPVLVAWIAFRPQWRRAAAVMALTILVDLDHLLADPIYQPDRCSLGFHPLHTWPAIAGWALLLLHPRTAPVGMGLLLHMALDAVDCVLM